MAEAATADMAHVLVFPFPMQGHLNGFLHFSTGLLRAGLHVTFLHTDHNLRRLGAAAREAAAASPRLRFLSVPDGLPDDDPRAVDGIPRLLHALNTTGAAPYRDLLASLRRRGADGFPPVTCVVADGIMQFAWNIPEELGVPTIAFRTGSASIFLAFLSMPKLFELGELPFPKGGGDLDEPVRGVPGMASFLRRRDLPVQCRSLTETHEDPLLKAVVAATVDSRRARALILNTTASLEGPSLAHLAEEMRDVFAVGPLHAMFPAPAAATSLWLHDDGCMAWLDGQQEARSVVYISLGSLTVISHEQFTEFLHGLIAAGYPFLWVLRPDMLGSSQDAALREALAAVGESRALVVPWAPQRDVLRHRAVGCFLTHSGWNSTIEGVVEGVPMVCWPFFADQQINSRFVGAVWGNGLDMKDVCKRDVVEGMVREAMESDEVRRSARALAEQVERDIADGGSSAMEFKRLVGFIRELSRSTSAADENGLQNQE
ncbi:unnamed protein product [Urochloa humidicola]